MASILSSTVTVGNRAPDFTQSDPKDQPLSLSCFKGRYVLLYFWASWCGQCRAENPNVVKLYQQYKEKGFIVYGVSLDGEGTKTARIKATANDGLTWTLVSDLEGLANGAAKAYDVKSIPQNFLVDPNGKIVAKNLRGESLAKELSAIFNK